MKNLFFSILLISCSVAHAQHLVDSHTNLDSLSHEYLKVGDSYCLVIDALKDGLIKQGICYNIQFSHNVLTINGQNATVEMSARYLDKIKQLNKYRGLPDNDRYNCASMNGSGGISIDKPQPYVSAKTREEQKQKIKYTNSLLVSKLFADGFIYSRDEVYILYTDDGIWINNRKLSVKQERKYTPLVALVAYEYENNERAHPHHNSSIRLTGY